MTITFHEVRPGDSIYSIARTYDVDPTDVRRPALGQRGVGPDWLGILHVGELLEIRSDPTLYIIEEEPW